MKSVKTWLFLSITGQKAQATKPVDLLQSHFSAWKSRHEKHYSSLADEAVAFSAFRASDEVIRHYNSLDLSFTLGHNKFSDLTQQQFRALYVGGKGGNPVTQGKVSPQFADNYTLSRKPPQGYVAPVDWVSKGAVTKVKNQGQCGDCWAFATIGAVEGAYQIAGNPLTNFSEQFLVSCDNTKHHGTDDACQGGDPGAAMQWALYNPLCTQDAYPYTSGEGVVAACDQSRSRQGVVAAVKGHTMVPGEPGMYAALAQQPLAVEVEADMDVFRLYKSGVLDTPLCGTEIDHGVLVVGLGTDASSAQPFWRIKNSWGPGWGEGGFIRLVRDKNMCGISHSPCFPTVERYAPVCDPISQYCSPTLNLCATATNVTCVSDTQCASLSSSRGGNVFCDPVTHFCATSGGVSCESPCTVKSEFCSPELHLCLSAIFPKPPACSKDVPCAAELACDPLTSSCMKAQGNCLGP